MKTVQNGSKQTSVDFDVKGQQGMDFFTGGNIIMDYGLVFWPELEKVKMPYLMYEFVSYKHAAFHFTRQ